MLLLKKRLLFFSLILNVLFVLTGLFLMGKRWYFEYTLPPPAVLETYYRNPQYAEQIQIEPAYIRPVKIIMLGNSLMYKAHWDELLNRGDIGNRGIGSDITEGYLHRLNYVLDCHPRICFIEGGINDLELHYPVDTTIAHLEMILDSLHSARIIPVLHTVLYVS